MSTVDPTAPEPVPATGSGPPRARLLDEVAANSTPAPLTRLVDGWLCKAAPELPFRRANAVLPATVAGRDSSSVADTIAAIEAWYRSIGQRVLIQVSSAGQQVEDLDRLLDDRGYLVEAPVDVLVADAVVIADAGSRAGDRLRVTSDEATTVSQADFAASGPVTIAVATGVDDRWCETYGALHGSDDRTRARVRGYGLMLGGLGSAVLAASAITTGDGPVGVGFAVLERGWAGIFGMATAPAWRRRGVAGSLVGALARDVHRLGATHVYLQVETDNAAGQSLCRGLGFTRNHGYHYRVSERPASRPRS